jgi:hypothetical protein
MRRGQVVLWGGRSGDSNWCNFNLCSSRRISVTSRMRVNGVCISEIRPMFDGVYDIVLAGYNLVARKAALARG